MQHTWTGPPFSLSLSLSLSFFSCCRELSGAARPKSTGRKTSRFLALLCSALLGRLFMERIHPSFCTLRVRAMRVGILGREGWKRGNGPPPAPPPSPSLFPKHVGVDGGGTEGRLRPFEIRGSWVRSDAQHNTHSWTLVGARTGAWWGRGEEKNKHCF